MLAVALQNVWKGVMIVTPGFFNRTQASTGHQSDVLSTRQLRHRFHLPRVAFLDEQGSTIPAGGNSSLLGSG
jgi:hypothetical protein